jgi:hypothetical protein
MPPFLQAAAFFVSREHTMRLFMFKSESNRELYAFAADPGGRPLPSRHGPWSATGVVRDDSEPPHKMNRKVIEQSITDQGFQLYKKRIPSAQ